MPSASLRCRLELTACGMYVMIFSDQIRSRPADSRPSIT